MTNPTDLVEAIAMALSAMEEADRLRRHPHAGWQRKDAAWDDYELAAQAVVDAIKETLK